MKVSSLREALASLLLPCNGVLYAQDLPDDNEAQVLGVPGHGDGIAARRSYHRETICGDTALPVSYLCPAKLRVVTKQRMPVRFGYLPCRQERDHARLRPVLSA